MAIELLFIGLPVDLRTFAQALKLILVLCNDSQTMLWFKNYLSTMSYNNSDGLRSLKDVRNRTDVSLIPGRGIGGRNNPSRTIYEANLEVRAWFGK